MTVAELIAKLEEFPGDTMVAMAKDREGNEFSPLDERTGEVYIATSTWSGVLASDEDDEDEDGNVVGGIDAVILWPVN